MSYHPFQYKATDVVVEGAGKFELVLTNSAGKETRYEAFNFKDGGVVMGMYNTDEVSDGQVKGLIKVDH